MQQELLKKILKQNGQSVTKARLAVFRALLGHEPMGMRDLTERAKRVDRASVYRAVELFERLGIAQRLVAGWKYKIELTDKFSDHHHHLTCLNCGRIITIDEDKLEQALQNLVKIHNFQPSAHQVEIQGLCKECNR